MGLNEGFIREIGATQTVVFEVDPDQEVGETKGERKQTYNAGYSTSAAPPTKEKLQANQQVVVQNPNGSFVTQATLDERKKLLLSFGQKRKR